MNRCSAFTLVELLISISIISILAVLAVPRARNAYIRAQVVRCQTDIKCIEAALNAYHVDWGNYPPTNLAPLSFSLPIDQVNPIKKPVAYLPVPPYAPWYRSIGEIHRNVDGNVIKENGYQGNYSLAVTTCSIYGVKQSGPLPDWSLSCGGPLTLNTGSNSSNWYTPTNGLISAGGFWLDSDGVSSI